MRKCLFCNQQDEKDFVCRNHSETVYNFDFVSFWVPDYDAFYVAVRDDYFQIGYQTDKNNIILTDKFINQSYQELVEIAHRCIKQKALL